MRVVLGAGLMLGAAVWAQAAHASPFEGVFGLEAVPGMTCATNPMTLRQMGPEGPVVMTWRDPVRMPDGTASVRMEFRFGRLDGNWLYLSNVGRDVALLRYSQGFDRFVLLADVSKIWTGTDDPRAAFVRCASLVG